VRILKSLDHVFAIFDSSLADPGGGIVHEIPIAPEKVGDDEPAKRQPLGQALYIEISPHTGMRANGLSSGNTASNTGPPTFSK
jgi:hypothetical protein